MENKPTRGERNNNPGNIRKTGIDWRGEVNGADDAFETFETASGGIRALAKLLLNYQLKHGLRTIREIVNRWAPPSENNTVAYVAAVAKETGFLKDSVVNLTDLATLQKLTTAIIKHENGRVIYSDDLIASSIRSIFTDEKQPPAPVVERGTQAKEKDMAPFIAAALPSLISSIPEFARIFSKQDVAERNTEALVKASEVIMAAVDAPNIQAAVEKIQSNPAAAGAANDALRANRAELVDMMERISAIEQKSVGSARKFNSDEKSVVGRWKFVHILSLIVVIGALAAIGHILAYSDDPTERAMALQAILLVGFSGVMSYWVGSSNSSQRKDELRNPSVE